MVNVSRVSKVSRNVSAPLKLDRVRDLPDEQAFLDITEASLTSSGQGTFKVHRLLKVRDCPRLRKFDRQSRGRGIGVFVLEPALDIQDPYVLVCSRPESYNPSRTAA